MNRSRHARMRAWVGAANPPADAPSALANIARPPGGVATRRTLRRPPTGGEGDRAGRRGRAPGKPHPRRHRRAALAAEAGRRALLPGRAELRRDLRRARAADQHHQVAPLLLAAPPAPEPGPRWWTSRDQPKH